MATLKECLNNREGSPVRHQVQTEGVVGGGAYEADEGSDVGPAVLHEGVWPVANHVCDVVVETVRTWGGRGGGGVGRGERRCGTWMEEGKRWRRSCRKWRRRWTKWWRRRCLRNRKEEGGGGSGELGGRGKEKVEVEEMEMEEVK